MYAMFNIGVVEGVFRFERQGANDDNSSDEDKVDSDR